MHHNQLQESSSQTKHNKPKTITNGKQYNQLKTTTTKTSSNAKKQTIQTHNKLATQNNNPKRQTSNQTSKPKTKRDHLKLPKIPNQTR